MDHDPPIEPRAIQRKRPRNRPSEFRDPPPITRARTRCSRHRCCQ